MQCSCCLPILSYGGRSGVIVKCIDPHPVLYVAIILRGLLMVSFCHVWRCSYCQCCVLSLVVKVTRSWGLDTCNTILMSYFCLVTKGAVGCYKADLWISMRQTLCTYLAACACWSLLYLILFTMGKLFYQDFQIKYMPSLLLPFLAVSLVLDDSKHHNLFFSLPGQSCS